MPESSENVPATRRLVRAVSWRAHRLARNWVWSQAHVIRRVRPASAATASPKRVLHVTTSFDLGGTQKQIEHLARFPQTRFEHRVVEIFPELNYLFRPDVGVDAQRYVRGGVVRRAMGRAVVNRNRRGWQLVQVSKLVDDFEAERPQIVVGWGHEICVTTFVAAALARVPHIVFCIRTVSPDHGWTDDEFSRLLRRAHRRMTPLVDRVVVNSTFLQQDHAAWVPMNAATIGVCANGVAFDALASDATAAARCRIRRMFSIPEDAVVIVNVGRFSPEKGQLSLVDANRRLLPRSPRPIVWLLCGDGHTLADVQAAAAAQSMTNVVFTGRTTVVADILAASDVFVMPSDFEGMPNAMMEAMAAGLPCVSTARSGARDVARDGIEALYYEPGDVATLVEHLVSLIADTDRAGAMGLAAKSRIREFDVTRFVRCFEEQLDGLASAHTEPRAPQTGPN